MNVWKRLFRSSQRASETSFSSRISVINQLEQLYVNGTPRNQSIVDLVDGWNCAFPEEISVVAGHLHLYADPRIEWAIEQAGELNGKAILEVGPLEGGHSCLLQRYLPKSHIAVEANKKAFLKCLIAKELYPLPNVRFMLGDAIAYLQNVDTDFDLIIASGILYHLSDPLLFLELAAYKCSALYLWTHFIDAEFNSATGDLRQGAFSSPMETDHRFGFPVRYRRRRYHGAEHEPHFSGGLSDEHIWLFRDDLFTVLTHLGFKRIVVAHEEQLRDNGPACSIFAER